MAPAEDIRASSLQKPIKVVEYLYRRLHEVGVRSVHGVPGDYNLVALDYLEPNGLSWVGNCNELNAGYACDGYARIKGIGAMITTYGVGELSALNAIAGSYAEYVPVVHIVGTPSTLSQKAGMILHHTLGNGDYTVFANMSQNISCASSKLNDPMNAAELIDHAIQQCYIQSRPVYITLPTDMVLKTVEGARLDTPLDLKFAENDTSQEDYAVEEVLRFLHAAKKPCILVDACAIRHRALAETNELIVKSGLPTFVAPMGKGAVDETLPNYGGVYAGNGSHQDVQEFVESSDLVLSIGSIKSDFNTAGFTYHTSQLNTINFHSYSIQVKYSEFLGCRMNGVLRKIVARMGKISVHKAPSPAQAATEQMKKPAGDEAITHDWVWPQFSDWVQEKDVFLSETGTSNYGIWEVLFKRGVEGINQILWGSIGYATGSCQGAALAAKETAKQRVVLFTGEGSMQLTVQELSTMLRLRLNPIIFVINNEGYTIERCIHGMDAKYNNVASWNYTALPSALGGDPNSFKTYQVRTRKELRALLADAEFGKSDKLRLVEMFMPKDDAPITLKMTAEAAAKNNAKE